MKDETEFLIAQIGQRIPVERADVHAIEEIMSGARAIEAADGVHERGFARAARTHDGDEFARHDAQRDAAHGVDFHFAGLIDLLEIVERDDGFDLRVHENSWVWLNAVAACRR